jgi:hypothetical protein
VYHPNDYRNTDRIRQLNDAFRQSMSGGRVLMTHGVAAMANGRIARLAQIVRTYDQFGPDNDPHGEHDFGSFEEGGDRFFFKIDYYDPTLAYGSEDPADPSRTVRVLTIMLASEY